MKMRNRLGGLVCVCLLLAACTETPTSPPALISGESVYQPLASGSQTPAVNPPLVMPSSSPTLPVPVLNLQPTATLVCKDNLHFLEDLTVPDGTAVKPDEIVDKQWKVENTGTCNWDESYRLRLVQGPSLGATTEQALYPARGGASAVIRILFTAPHQPGTYRSAWQAHTPGGEAFGETIFIEIVVIGL